MVLSEVVSTEHRIDRSAIIREQPRDEIFFRVRELNLGSSTSCIKSQSLNHFANAVLLTEIKIMQRHSKCLTIRVIKSRHERFILKKFLLQIILPLYHYLGFSSYFMWVNIGLTSAMLNSQHLQMKEYFTYILIYNAIGLGNRYLSIFYTYKTVTYKTKRNPPPHQKKLKTCLKRMHLNDIILYQNQF